MQFNQIVDVKQIFSLCQTLRSCQAEQYIPQFWESQAGCRKNTEELWKCLQHILVWEKEDPCIKNLFNFLSEAMLRAPRGNAICSTIVEILRKLLQTSHMLNTTVRYRSCQLIFLILEAVPQHISLPYDFLQELDNVVTNRLIEDRIVKIRVAAVKLLAIRARNEKQNLEKLLEVLNHDDKKDVRKEVLKQVDISDETVEQIIVRCKDVSTEVRQLVQQKCKEKVNYRSLSVEQRVLVLQCGLQDESTAVNKSCKELIQCWLGQVDGNIIEFMDLLQVSDNIVCVEAVMQTFFESGKLDLRRLVENLQSVTQDVDDEKELENGRVFLWVWVCKYLKGACEDGSQQVAQLSEVAGAIRAGESKQLYDALELLVPSMQSVAKAIQNHTTFNSPFVVQQLLQLATHCVDFSDGFSRKTAEEVIKELLSLDPRETDELLGGGDYDEGKLSTWNRLLVEFSVKVVGSQEDANFLVASQILENSRKWLKSDVFHQDLEQQLGEFDEAEQVIQETQCRDTVGTVDKVGMTPEKLIPHIIGMQIDDDEDDNIQQQTKYNSSPGLVTQDRLSYGSDFNFEEANVSNLDQWLQENTLPSPSQSHFRNDGQHGCQVLSFEQEQISVAEQSQFLQEQQTGSEMHAEREQIVQQECDDEEFIIQGDVTCKDEQIHHLLCQMQALFKCNCTIYGLEQDGMLDNLAAIAFQAILNQNSLIRGMALEVLGIITTLDGECICMKRTDKLAIFVGALQNDVLEVQIIAARAICDIILIHGIRNYSLVDDEDTVSQPVLDILREKMMQVACGSNESEEEKNASQQQQLLQILVFGLCKFLLYHKLQQQLSENYFEMERSEKLRLLMCIGQIGFAETSEEARIQSGVETFLDKFVVNHGNGNDVIEVLVPVVHKAFLKGGFSHGTNVLLYLINLLVKSSHQNATTSEQDQESSQSESGIIQTQDPTEEQSQTEQEEFYDFYKLAANLIMYSLQMLHLRLHKNMIKNVLESVGGIPLQKTKDVKILGLMELVNRLCSAARDGRMHGIDQVGEKLKLQFQKLNSCEEVLDVEQLEHIIKGFQMEFWQEVVEEDAQGQ